MEKSFADHVRDAVDGDGPVLLFARGAQLAILAPVDKSFRVAILDMATLTPIDGTSYPAMREGMRKDGWAVLGRLR